MRLYCSHKEGFVLSVSDLQQSIDFALTIATQQVQYVGFFVDVATVQ